MSLPETRNLSVYEGDSFRFTFRLRNRNSNGDTVGPVNMTGAVVQAQIRSSENASTVVAEFDASHNEAGGVVTLQLTPDQTAVLVDGKWDVQVIWPDGTVKTYLRGNVTVMQEITRV